jgi:hypothetical protein
MAKSKSRIYHRAKGEFITEPKDKYGETRCYIPFQPATDITNGMNCAHPRALSISTSILPS